MREKTIETLLREHVRSLGGLCEKWNAGSSGWPDRIILLPDGKVAFAELKAPGRKPRKLQLYRHEQLRKRGFLVFVIDDAGQIGGVIDEIQTS